MLGEINSWGDRIKMGNILIQGVSVLVCWCVSSTGRFSYE